MQKHLKEHPPFLRCSFVRLQYKKQGCTVMPNDRSTNTIDSRIVPYICFPNIETTGHPLPFLSKCSLHSIPNIQQFSPKNIPHIAKTSPKLTDYETLFVLCSLTGRRKLLNKPTLLTRFHKQEQIMPTWHLHLACCS